MTPEELLEAIDADPNASRLAIAGDDQGCAGRMMAILPPVRVFVSTRDIMKIASRNQKWGAIALTCSDTSKDYTVRVVCKTLVDYVATGDSIDFTLGSVQLMMQVLLSASLISQADINEIELLSWSPQTISANEVSVAMMPRRPGGHL